MLNSHRFFRDISLAVLDELPPDEGIAITPTEGDPGLWPVIRDRNHQIIMTKGIEKQYSREIQGEGFTEILLSQVVGYLAEEGLIIRPKLPGGV